jgi:hypothetical protein
VAIIAFGFAFVACDDGNGKTDPTSKDVLDTVHTYTAAGELTSYSEPEYDSQGNQTKVNTYNAAGELSSYDVYTYKTITL